MAHFCFISSVFGREDALIVYRQGISLAKAGYKVSFLLCDGKPDETRYGIEMISIADHQPSQSKRVLFNRGKIKNYLKNTGCKADVFQISEPELLPLASFLKRRGFKVVFNLREYYPEYFALKFKNKIIRKLVRGGLEKYFKHVSKNFDAVFNCMPEMSEYIRGIMPCRFFEDLPNFPVVNDDFALSFEDYCKRDNIISYFGTIYSISCQEEFLQAIEDIPTIKYLLAGVINEDYKKRLMIMPGWKKVSFKNGFTRQELPDIINCSIMGNVMKDFNKTETPEGSFSIIKIFESMEAAIPVILAKVPLYEKMVSEYKCGICCDPHNVEEIRNAITFLMNNKRSAYEMGQNGRRAVIERFSWNCYEDKYLSIINQLTDSIK